MHGKFDGLVGVSTLWFAHMRLTYLLSAALLLGGCGDFDAAGDSFQDDDPPIGDCPGTSCPDTSDGFGDEGAGVGEPCDNTLGCSGIAVCAAEFDDGEAGPLTCQADCIGEMDESMWCSDDSACCDAGATCSSRGFCEVPEGLDESGDDTTGDSTSSGGDGESSGDPDATSTGSGSTDGTDSGTTSDGSGTTGTGTGA